MNPGGYLRALSTSPDTDHVPAVLSWVISAQQTCPIRPARRAWNLWH
jgi:hypothetical protein